MHEYRFLTTWLVEAERAAIWDALWDSARWPESWDPTGRRVGVIGTGSSAVQFVPRIQPSVDALTVFQRTPAWVIPHRTHPVSARRRRLYRRVPLTQKAVRAWIYVVHELYGLAMVRNRTDAIEKLARGHLAAQVADPSLRAALTPTSALGDGVDVVCGRLLPQGHSRARRR